MSDLHHVSKFAERRRRNNIWRSVVTFVAALVVFCTTYALILPAITMETEGLSCGMEAHTHTEECCQLTCGKQEYFSHTHTEECYEEEELICPLEERTIHHHTDDCYSSAQPICGLSQCEPHAHSEGCYGLQNVLICGQSACEPHAHGESCYTDGTLTCTLEETAGHTHTEECYEEQQALTCTLEETEGHTHTEECYPSDFEPKLICEQEDIPEHRHTEDCYIRTCEKEAHIHTDECVSTPEAFLQNQNVINPNVEAGVPKVDWTDPTAAEEEGYYLICGSQEEDHIHSQDCYLLSEDLVDWSDPTSAEAAGFVLLCEEENEEHVHTEDCYAFFEDLLAIGDPVTFNAPAAEGEAGTNSGIMLMAGGTIPLVENGFSATGVKYNAEKDTFSAFVQITFSFPGKESEKAVLPNTDYTYTYPKGVTIPDGLLNKNQTLKDKAGKPAGTYSFVKNADNTYTVHASFTEDYVQKNVAVGTDKSVEGYINYAYEFSASDRNGDKLKFGESGYELPISLPVEYPDKTTTENYNIDVSKAGGWQQQEDKLTYTVYVRTTKGTPNPISLADTMTDITGLTLGDPTISVEKGTTNYYSGWSQDLNDWTSVSDVPHSNSGGTLSMSLPGLSAREAVDGNNTPCIAGEVYRITYFYPITDQAVAQISPKNTVSVTATDANKGQTVTDSANTSTNISKDFSYTVTKNGEIASDKEGKYLKWTVALNTNKQDLSKAEFTDDMLKEVQDPSQDIIIDPKNNINVDAANGKITFTPVENGVNKNTYTITYYTPYTETWNGTTKTNKATLVPDKDNPNDKKKADATVTVSGVQLSKDGGQNPVTKKLDWVITVNAGELDIAGATLTDDVFTKLDQGALTIEPNTGYDFVQVDGKITGITFHAPAEGGENRTKYTIMYSTDAPTAEGGSPVPSVTNRALLTPREGVVGLPVPAEKTIQFEDANITKTGSDYDSYNKKINWTVTVNDNHKDIAGAELTDEMLSTLKADQISIVDQSNASVSDGEITIRQDENGYVTKIIFNAIGETTVNTNQYIITYSTNHLQQWSDRIVHNEAKLTVNGKEIPKTADVTVPGSGQIAKTAGQGTVNGNTLTIPWTVTLTVPEGGLAKGTIITDDVTKNQWGNSGAAQWMTEAQKIAQMTWTDDTGVPKGTVSLSDAIVFTSGGEGYQGFTITLAEDLIPPEGATKLTFTYSTTADLSTAASDQITFYNMVDADGRQSSAQYIYYKPSVQKTDGDGQTGPSTVSSPGSLTWKVKAKAGANNQKLTLVDTLPQGVTLDSLLLASWNNTAVELTIGNDGKISGMDNTNTYAVSGSYENGTIRLDISHKDSGQRLSDGMEFNLTVNCSVTDAQNVTGTKELTNNVTMQLDDTDIGSSSQTQNWNYQAPQTKAVSKTGQWDNDARYLTYTIIINPDGKDLDSNPESKKQELVDVLEYNMQLWPGGQHVNLKISLDPGSVQLTHYDGVKNDQKVAGSDWLWTYATQDNSFQAKNTLTVTIPDETPLVLKYTYNVSSDAPDGVTFILGVSNTATLQGTGYQDIVQSDEAQKWQNQSTIGGITSSSSLLTLTKVDATNNGLYLEGAKFSISAYRVTTTEGVTTGSWEYKWTDTTDKNGAITIVQGDAAKQQRVYETDVLYKMVETKAPFGYLLQTPVSEYYFYFSGSKTMAVPEGFSLTNAIDLNKIGNSIIVTNTKAPTTSIQVDKQWQDKNGAALTNPGGSVSVSLYQKTTQGSTPAVPEGTLVKTVTLDNTNNWTHTFTDLPLTGLDENGNTVSYYYYVVEEPNANFQASYENNEGIQQGTITVTNKVLDNPTYTLPNTGGMGTSMFTLAGLALSIGACLGLVKKRRKGER